MTFSSNSDDPLNVLGEANTALGGGFFDHRLRLRRLDPGK